MNDGFCLVRIDGRKTMNGFFDRLPKSHRQLLSNSKFNLCPACFEEIEACIGPDKTLEEMEYAVETGDQRNLNSFKRIIEGRDFIARGGRRTGREDYFVSNDPDPRGEISDIRDRRREYLFPGVMGRQGEGDGEPRPFYVDEGVPNYRSRGDYKNYSRELEEITDVMGSISTSDIDAIIKQIGVKFGS